MSNFLQIADSDFQDAANVISKFLTDRGQIGVDPSEIENALRSYVYLGQNKTINDWSYLLSQDEKSSITDAVVSRMTSHYFLNPDPTKVYNDFDIMETQADNGVISPIISRPRYYEEQYETAVNTPTPIANENILTAGIQQFLGWVRDGVESVLKGLGIDIPLPVIIGIVVVILILIFSDKFKTA
jgi:hypothetical protein